MSLFYPKIRLAWLPAMLGYAVLGSLLAGFYGILHDQITYSISPEYFTRLKFAQFQYANLGFPARVFVAEIGFLASWWVGFFAAWFIARITVPAFPPAKAFRYSLRGFLIILAFAFATSIVGYVLGVSVILLFLGNLVTATNTSSALVLIPGAVASLLATPAWNLWLGLRFLQ